MALRAIETNFKQLLYIEKVIKFSLQHYLIIDNYCERRRQMHWFNQEYIVKSNRNINILKLNIKVQGTIPRITFHV